MCSFSCWLVIQSLAVSAKRSAAYFELCRVCESNSCSRLSVLQHGGSRETHLARCCPAVVFVFCFVAGANQKKPSAPDMFTESDDMFAADFDVSALSCASTLAIRCCCHVKMEVGNNEGIPGVKHSFTCQTVVLLCRVQG